LSGKTIFTTILLKISVRNKNQFLFCVKKFLGSAVNLLFEKLQVNYSGLSKKLTFD